MVETLTAADWAVRRTRGIGRLSLLALTVSALLAGGSEAATSRAVDRLAGDPSRLQALVRAMPKGGDLHDHLSGAVHAESCLG